MKRRIEPLGEMVLLKAIRTDVSEGGVLLPETAVAKKALGHIVLARGEEVEGVAVGETVLIHGNGAFIHMDGVEEDIFLVKQEQILGVIHIVEEDE